MANPTPLPPKRDVARALLLRGSVFVHLDPRREGVRVPEWLHKQPQVVLQIGLELPVPIPDLKVDDRGVRGTLSFQRAPFACDVPWAAVFALVDDNGHGMVWPEDVPEEIASELERSARPAKRTSAPLKSKAAAEPTPITAARTKGQLYLDAKGNKRRVGDGSRLRAQRQPTPQKQSLTPDVVQLDSARPPPSRSAAKRSTAGTARAKAAAPKPVALKASATKSTAASRPPARPSTSKPKRELPPYLRVIK